MPGRPVGEMPGQLRRGGSRTISHCSTSPRRSPARWASLQLPALAEKIPAAAFADTYWVAWSMVLLTVSPAMLLPRKHEQAHPLDDEGLPPVVVH